jgi:hypothetical protein
VFWEKIIHYSCAVVECCRRLVFIFVNRKRSTVALGIIKAFFNSCFEGTIRGHTFYFDRNCVRWGYYLLFWMNCVKFIEVRIFCYLMLVIGKNMISWFYAYVEHIEIKTKTVNIIHFPYLDLSPAGDLKRSPEPSHTHASPNHKSWIRPCIIHMT